LRKHSSLTYENGQSYVLTWTKRKWYKFTCSRFCHAIFFKATFYTTLHID